MEKARKKETISNNTQIVTRSKKRNKEEEEEGDENKNSVSSSIHLDLIIEILVKLPPKSIAKFLCVSKLWYSTIRGKCFNDLFLTRSLTRPCFLFTFRLEGNRFFHSHEEHSLLSALSLHDRDGIGITLDRGYKISSSARGLICCHNAFKLKICNPTIGQVLSLPNAKSRRRGVSSFLGYDSVEDVHKVLFMTVLNVPYNNPPVVSAEHQVLTLRPGKKIWRMIECKKHPHCPMTRGLYKDDVVYYGVWSNSHGDERSMIVCFDVRLEEFSVIKLPENVKILRYNRQELVNYHGKLALADESYRGKVDFWVLEDVEKQEWSQTYVVVPFWGDLFGPNYFRCIGTISTGEIIFAWHFDSPSHPFFVVYYDPKRDIARRVVFEGTQHPCAIDMNVFLDHVESLMLL